MKRTVPKLSGAARKLAKAEIIGLSVKIATANDAGLVGLEGELVDETLHTVTLRIDGPGGRRVQVGKIATTFAFGDILVDGAAIDFRSEDRTKKVK